MQQPDYKDGEKVIAMVGRALTAITARLQSMAQFDGTESKVKQISISSLSVSKIFFRLYEFSIKCWNLDSK